METKIIGSRIAEGRKKKNLSQSQLAESLFISAQAVGKWERGESLPDIITLNRLAKIIGVDLNHFSDDFKSAEIETIQMEAKDNDREKLNWNMSRGNWVDADFSGLKDLHEKFSSSNMKNSKFYDSDLSGLVLKNNYIDGCDFSGSKLGESRIENSHLVNNSWEGAAFTRAGFSGCHVKNSDFSGADLSGTHFRSSALQKNKLTGAKMDRTSFYRSALSDLVFEGQLENCSFEDNGFTRVTFQNCTLINTFFKGKLKGMKFINCSADKLTYEFLKNGKADLSGLSLI